MPFNFPAIIAHVCQCTGWTWDYVLWHIDLVRLEHLMAHWADSPPINLMLASYFGIDVGGKRKDKDDKVEDIAELPRTFGSDPQPLPPQDLTIGSSHLRK